MNIEEFYTAIRHKFEPETLAETNEEALTYGTRLYLKFFNTRFISRDIPANFLGPIRFLYRRMYVLEFSCAG
ncbi:MAG: hypothetical protein Q8Q56_00055 [Alphaproteobacteria bacterium]|nr:hypothetical protein [Alphaproteobacteria bacterium]